MNHIPKLKPGDKIAILSPSSAAPSRWPEVYELGLQRIRDVFKLEPVEFPTTRVQGTGPERAKDLIAAFLDPSIRAVMATIGGDDQVTYIKNLPPEPFINNPKPFFGYSDNTHFENFLWLHNIPSFYGSSVLTQLAMQGQMDPFTLRYLTHALFDHGEFELEASPTFNDIGYDWSDTSTLTKRRIYEQNDGWYWDGKENARGITWGGCIESIDELLRHGAPIPTLEQFEEVILMFETSEEMPSASYVSRIYRALGERGILSRIKGLVVGRPKAWEFDNQRAEQQKVKYKSEHRDMTLKIVRKYNDTIPIVQNVDFGHTDPQIPMPYGGMLRLESKEQKMFATF